MLLAHVAAVSQVGGEGHLWLRRLLPPVLCHPQAKLVEQLRRSADRVRAGLNRLQELLRHRMAAVGVTSVVPVPVPVSVWFWSNSAMVAFSSYARSAAATYARLARRRLCRCRSHRVAGATPGMRHLLECGEVRHHAGIGSVR